MLIAVIVESVIGNEMILEDYLELNENLLEWNMGMEKVVWLRLNWKLFLGIIKQSTCTRSRFIRSFNTFLIKSAATFFKAF